MALKCADLSDIELGVSSEIAFKRITMLIKGVAAAYKANRSYVLLCFYFFPTAVFATFF